MMMRSILMRLGVLPFLLLTLLSFFSLPTWLSWLQPHEALSAYALVILTFMAGTHWGMYLASEQKGCNFLLLSSNVIALGCWVVVWFKLSILWLLLGFAWQLWVDWGLWRRSAITRLYWHNRVMISGLVMICLLVVGFR